MVDYGFNTKLTPLELELFDKLVVFLKVEGRTTFTSDDLQLFGLSKFIEDTEHGTGTLIAKLKINRLTEPTGREIPSKIPRNHRHKVREWKIRGLEATPMLLRSFTK